MAAKKTTTKKKTTKKATAKTGRTISTGAKPSDAEDASGGDDNDEPEPEGSEDDGATDEASAAAAGLRKRRKAKEKRELVDGVYVVNGGIRYQPKGSNETVEVHPSEDALNPTLVDDLTDADVENFRSAGVIAPHWE